jgi:hypothetical protein
MEVSEDDVRGEELETERLRHYRLINKGEIMILTFVLWRKTGRWEKKTSLNGKRRKIGGRSDLVITVCDVCFPRRVPRS